MGHGLWGTVKAVTVFQKMNEWFQFENIKKVYFQSADI